MLDYKSHFKLVIMQNFPPWFVLKNDGSAIGIVNDMLRETVRRLNFTYVLRFPKKGEVWGQEQADGNWTGMVGMLQREEADIMINPIANTAHREKYVDFSVSFYTGHFGIVSGINRAPPDSLFKILETFDIQVWLIILVSIFLLSTVATMSDVQFNLEKGIPTNLFTTWSSYFSDFLAAFFSEATPHDPKRDLPRFLVILWCLSVLVLMNLFGGQFMSTLTISKDANLIDTVEDLARTDGKMEILTWKGSEIEDLIKNSQQKSTKRVKQIIESKNGFVSVRDMYTHPNYVDLISGKMAMVTEETTLKHFLGKMCHVGDGGNVHMSKEKLNSINLTWAVKKTLDPRFKNSLNEVLLRLSESGLIRKWMDDMYQDYERCQTFGPEAPVEKALALKDTRAAYALWSVFSLLSVVAFLFEFLTCTIILPIC